MNILKEHLVFCFPALQKSEMVINPSKNSGYEKEICNILGMDCVDNRYMDATWDKILYPIELKKGNVWVNAIRIAEQSLETPFQEVLWIYFNINKHHKRIDEIICFKLSDFIKLIGLDDVDQANAIISSYKFATSRGCGNNNQWSVNPSQIRDIAQFTIEHPDYSPRKRRVEVTLS